MIDEQRGRLRLGHFMAGRQAGPQECRDKCSAVCVWPVACLAGSDQWPDQDPDASHCPSPTSFLPHLGWIGEGHVLCLVLHTPACLPGKSGGSGNQLSALPLYLSPHTQTEKGSACNTHTGTGNFGRLEGNLRLTQTGH